MAATNLGNNWAPIWESGVWNKYIWSQPNGVSIGRAWGTIWSPNVWATGVWSTGPFVSPVLVPSTLISTFDWISTGGAIVDVLKDGLDTTFIEATDVGSIVAFTLTESPFSTVTGATLRVRAKIQ